ncbi:ferredoxin [Allobranchiibius huperziae]|uniref:Ferredoxin n=1 Tax=Allobranchiibius huperziae TaxID=1874116 RepID=A0A853DCB6_9MICO|nr:ferredoxin [Allobranchiibius huperziae]NYJ73623.1 ferredoxin [Allobranchiibius huperziae]
MKIVLDRPRCEGHGLCEESAPQLMHLDDEGELVLDREDVTDAGDVAAATGAVRVCPVAALRLA